jgi:hypothetical protein
MGLCSSRDAIQTSHVLEHPVYIAVADDSSSPVHASCLPLSAADRSDLLRKAGQNCTANGTSSSSTSSNSSTGSSSNNDTDIPELVPDALLEGAGSSAPSVSGELLFGEANILHKVLSYAGSGHYFFFAAVASNWRDAYSRVESHLEYERALFQDEPVACSARMTLYSSLFASPARVQFAHKSVDCTAYSYRYAAGKHADSITLAASHELGMPFTAATLNGAAAVGALDKLQLLTAVLHCTPEVGVSEHAAMSGSVSVLHWLHEQESTVFSERACWLAAYHNQLPALQFLHSVECLWDYRVCSAAVRRENFDVLQWAHAHGCPWDRTCILGMAIATGSTAMVGWMLQQRGIVCDESIMAYAARKGNTL